MLFDENEQEYQNLIPEKELQDRLVYFYKQNQELKKQFLQKSKQIDRLEKEIAKKEQEYQKAEENMVKAELFLSKLENLISKYESFSSQENQNSDPNDIAESIDIIRRICSVLQLRNKEIEAFYKESLDLDQMVRSLSEFIVQYEETKHRMTMHGFFFRKRQEFSDYIQTDKFDQQIHERK